MYVVQSAACSVPNGSTPVTPADIAASQAILAALNGPANLAQSTFNALVTRTDLNTNGWPLATHGGTPAGPAGPSVGTAPTGGPTTGFRSWPSGKSACIATTTLPMGVNPVSLQATAAPPAPPAPSLVTQGHPSYTPPTGPQGGVFVPQGTDASGKPVYVIQKPTVQNSPALFAGLGCVDDSFWPGLISGLSLLASGLVLYEWLKKNGGLQF